MMIFNARVIAVVADEAHCIAKWQVGHINNFIVACYLILCPLNTGDQSTFRRLYSQIVELWSFLLTGTPILTLTATATKSVYGIVHKNLCMKDPVVVTRNQTTVIPFFESVETWRSHLGG